MISDLLWGYCIAKAESHCGSRNDRKLYNSFWISVKYPLPPVEGANSSIQSPIPENLLYCCCCKIACAAFPAIAKFGKKSKVKNWLGKQPTVGSSSLQLDAAIALHQFAQELDSRKITDNFRARGYQGWNEDYIIKLYLNRGIGWRQWNFTQIQHISRICLSQILVTGCIFPSIIPVITCLVEEDLPKFRFLSDLMPTELFTNLWTLIWLWLYLLLLSHNNSIWTWFDSAIITSIGRKFEFEVIAALIALLRDFFNNNH